MHTRKDKRQARKRTTRKHDRSRIVYRTMWSCANCYRDYPGLGAGSVCEECGSTRGHVTDLTRSAGA